ncbi:MAG TPA: NAD(P)-dependent oxidoreductase [Bryobacteraceae bacterium]|nr:NAD(P)-dependent oxidoreductase [Bryobacteraceae bacterium]
MSKVMRVFVAGATGAIGRRLLPILVQAGHCVTGMTRSPEKTAGICAAGAVAVVADALDPVAVMNAVKQSAPEVVVHELTAIPAGLDLRKFEREFAPTNRLRTEGTDSLLAAARAAGVRRFVAQSYGGWPYAHTGGAVKTEEDPLDPNPPAALRPSIEAIRHLETAVSQARGMEGIVLRYASFYGPGTAIGEGAAVVGQIRQRRIPVIGGGGGVWSFLHIDDAARATLAAIEGGAPGIYNVADNEPAPVSEWLPELAAILGAKPPLRIPSWLGRLAVGEHGVFLMTQVRGISNAKAKSEFGWQPVWGSWRDGFRRALGEDQRTSSAFHAASG